MRSPEFYDGYDVGAEGEGGAGAEEEINDCVGVAGSGGELITVLAYLAGVERKRDCIEGG